MQPTAPNILDAIPTLEADIPADSLAGIPPLLWVAAIGAVLILAAVIVAFILRVRRTRTLTAPLSPLQLVMQELQTLEDELPALRACSLQLSLMLRRYLAGRTQDTALYETQEEFNQRMDALAGVPDAVRPATRELLDELAGYKYAGEQLNDSMLSHALIVRARELVQQLETAREEEEQRKGGEEE